MSYTSQFSEKDLMNDLLMSEKQITSSYNEGINATASIAFRTALNTCLNNAQNCQFEILETMGQRGWYQIKEVDSDDIEKAKKKFSNLFNELL